MRRRDFLKTLSGVSATLVLSSSPLLVSACAGRSAKRNTRSTFDLSSVSPVDRSDHSENPTYVAGDDPAVPHEVLWNKNAFLASKTISGDSEVAPLVIVGGGMSGLFTTYLLRDLNPILLEQATRFGGNSKAESWNGLDYSVGAAYFVKPELGTPWQKLLTELEVDKLWRVKTGEDPVALESNIYERFWSGETARSQANKFRALEQYFQNVFNDQNGEVYPDIPYNDAQMRAVVTGLDQESFHSLVRRKCGGRIPTHIETVIEHYCWSTFGASSAELSAAAGLNNFAAEFGDLVVTPGGNAGVAERVLERLSQSIEPSRLRTQSLVVDVQARGNYNEVVYLDAGRDLKKIKAKAVVLACPKFVAKRLVDTFESDRMNAISKMTYRAYLVANVFLKKAPQKVFYDLYMLGNGTIDLRNVMTTSLQKKATDVVLGNFAYGGDASNQAVLTLYRAFPFEGGRAMLYSPPAIETYKREFEEQAVQQILPMLGLTSSDIAGVRIARWGHPMPVAKVGTYAKGIPDLLRKPHRESIFFAEQDNFLLPCIETCAEEAFWVAPRVRQLLKKGSSA